MRRPPPVESLEREVGFARSLARGLLSDEHLADDVVQQTWLTLLERPPPDARRLGAWFHTVSRNIALKGIRGATRRRRREAAAARPEAEPAAADRVERSTLLREVAEAVDGLGEPYRRTMIQRYYESLPPRKIAAREGVPVATVRSRIQRAHAQLRHRLGGRFGDRPAAFGAALVGLAEGRDPGPADAVRAGGDASPGTGSALRIAARAGAWIAPALVAASILVVPRLFVGEEADEAAIDPGRARTTFAEPPPLAAALDRSRDGAPADADALPADAPAGLRAGDRAVRVEVRRALDGSPAEGVTVRASDEVAVSEAPARDAVAKSDDAGVAWLTDVPLGRLALTSDRGGRTIVSLEGPGIVHAVVEVPLGVEVTGEVVDDDGRPVAGATIWCAGAEADAAGTEVAVADARGRFSIRDLPPDRPIAARAKGHAPSALRLLGADAGARLGDVRLELGAAGAPVRGTVLAPDGTPCAGATIAIERIDARIPLDPSGADSPATPPFRGRADAAGTCVAADLPIGRHALTAIAAGAAPHRETIEVRGAPTAPLTVTLRTGARVEGRAADAAGAPLADVRVTCAPADDALSPAVAWTDRDGRFALDAIPPGRATLAAGTDAGDVSLALALRDGTVERRDVVLPRGRDLAGRVVGADGTPIPGLRVRARSLDGRPLPPTSTDADGRFVIRGAGDRTYALVARRAGDLAPLAVGEFDLGRADEPILRAAPVERAFAGRLLAPSGHPIAAEVVATLVAPRVEASVRSTRTAPDGTFALRDLPPAAWRLEARAPGLGSVDLGTHVVRPGAGVDLGPRTLPRPGRLELSAPAGEVVAFVRSGGGAWRAVSLVDGAAGIELPPGPVEARPARGPTWRGAVDEGAATFVPLTPER
ncbi:MAG: sigma-70 family RNA polymerase sigma factor [Planctomycetota bacterium JB042]